MTKPPSERVEVLTVCIDVRSGTTRCHVEVVMQLA